MGFSDECIETNNFRPKEIAYYTILGIKMRVIRFWLVKLVAKAAIELKFFDGF